MSTARTVGAATAVGSAVVVALAVGMLVDAGAVAIVGAAIVGSVAALLVELLVDRGAEGSSPVPAGAEGGAPVLDGRGTSADERAETTAPRRIPVPAAVVPDRTERVAPVVPAAPAWVEPGAPVDLGSWRSRTWRRGGQCPSCGGWAGEIVDDGSWYRFVCARCAHRWRWQPGYAWPATLVRPDVGRVLAPPGGPRAPEEAEGAP